MEPNLTWLRALPLLLLSACTTIGEQGDDNAARVVATRDLVLQAAAGPPRAWEFQRGETRGRIDENGSWTLRHAVSHHRLLCATYQTGIQVGRGNPACSQVEWLTDVEYTGRRQQCNSATLLHSGNGEFRDFDTRFPSASCVRIVTRCEGNC